MTELKSREEMNPRFCWDYSDLFINDDAFESSLTELEDDFALLSKLKGTLGESAASLLKALNKVFETGEKLERVYAYAMLKKSSDGGNPKFQEMESRSISAYVKYQTAVAFLEPEILAIDAERLESFMQSEGLKPYAFFVENILRAKEHTLDEKGEEMLALLGDAAQAPSNAFDMLADVDFVYPLIKDENGKNVRLTNGNFGVFRESKLRRVRKAAFEAYLGQYKKFINTVTELYGGSVKLDNYFAAVRSYPSARAAALFGGNVPEAVYDSLIDAVHSKLPAMKRYLKLRKKVLGLRNLDLFDLYVPMVENVRIEMPYEKAKLLVKEALKPLGEKYGKLLDRAYGENWIDVYENKGKRSGAFSLGVYGVHPYVMLNYTDTLDDAFTLAHELGHAMHSYLSDEAQDYINHDYRIMVAEVASTVNEVLLTLHLLKNEKDSKRKALITNHFLDSFRTTLFRQTLFAEFERESHRMNAEGTPLTAESLCSLYKGLLETYYEGAKVGEVMQYEWAYIPHFYRAFYVYQYATGFASAVAIAKRILETGDASGYLKFLTLGGSDHPLEELKVAGIDLSKPATVESALELFEETVSELEELLK